MSIHVGLVIGLLSYPTPTVRDGFLWYVIPRFNIISCGDKDRPSQDLFEVSTIFRMTDDAIEVVVLRCVHIVLYSKFHSLCVSLLVPFLYSSVRRGVCVGASGYPDCNLASFLVS